MADQTAQERRAAARRHRRSAAGEPDKASISEAAEGATPDDPREALRTAASAAIAAAAVGAAQALARRRHAGAEPPEANEDEADDGDEHDDENERDEGPGNQAPVRDEPEAERPEPDERQASPAAPGEARRIVESARERLRELRGVDAESVSAVRRSGDGWVVSLEVVEVHRIPESTDVLGTYEVELDGDGDLLGFERTARYHRSEAERR